MTLSPSAAWRFLDSSSANGARQMAVDDALLTLCGQGQSSPTLRLFSFRPPCLSLGRFQPIPPETCREPALEVVRRPTGGRAVLHQRDICYSVIAPADHPLVAGSIHQSYAKIARALAEGLAILGLPPLEEAAAQGRLPEADWCFDAVAPHELALDGAKLVGSAQLRRDGILLQQGSIRLAHPDGEPPPTTSLEEALGRRVSRREIASALVEGFRRAWSVQFRRGRLTAEEEQLAQRLERERYANPAWTSRAAEAA
ncbi:MAG: lipoate--protein ligase family protein [Dehalococcoidia bacterium]|nr:MAG: lipoate--protein ligase family protein [Dehalococcoidia bacterium]